MKRNSVITIIFALLLITFIWLTVLTLRNPKQPIQKSFVDTSNINTMHTSENTYHFPEMVKAVLEDKSSFAESYMVLYAEPMTSAELENLGDEIVNTRRQQTSTYFSGHNLKIQVYWNYEVAKICLEKNYNGDTQFYNAFGKQGERISYSGLSSQTPKTLDDKDLFESLCKNDLLYLGAKNVSYDVDNQILNMENLVRSKEELIFDTFTLLGDGLRGCLFDKLPRLRNVRIIYTNKKDIIIGEATFDLNYWAEMIGIETSESESYLESYLNKWEKLFPLITSFRLYEELPVTTEDFFI